jgi:hypothetical protein
LGHPAFHPALVCVLSNETMRLIALAECPMLSDHRHLAVKAAVAQ